MNGEPPIGGVETGDDAAQFILLGAQTVQVCTGVMIHEQGDVVGQARCNISGGASVTFQPFVYFHPLGNPQGLTGMHPLPLPPGKTDGAAYDINEEFTPESGDTYNIVVGWAGIGAPPGSSADAVYWLMEPSMAVTAITSAPVNTQAAYGVSDIDPSEHFQIVGQHQLTVADPIGGFLWKNETGQFTDLQDLGVRSIVLDISPGGTLLAGVSGACVQIFPGSQPPQLVPPVICQGSPACSHNSDAVIWDPAAAPPLAVAALDQPAAFLQNGQPIAGDAFGVNASGHLTGLGTQGLDCVPPIVAVPSRALFWKSATAEPFNLHANAQNPFPSSDETYANAVNNAMAGAAPMVVGKNETTDRAVLWYDADAAPTAEDWVTVVVNTIIDQSHTPDSGWILLEATDVNDHGWICGYGAHSGSGQGERAFLAAPLNGDNLSDPCPIDANDDGVVNSPDLSLVIIQWGLCRVEAGCIDCRGDVNFDSAVDVQDLNCVILNWGTTGCGSCGGEGAAPSGGGAEDTPPLYMVFLQAGLTLQDYVDLITAKHMEDPNYRCWLVDYLNSDAAAVPVPPCPGADPFN